MAGLLDDRKKSQYLQMAEDKLQGLLNLPQQAQRFLTSPTAFLGLLGQNPLPRESGFAAGATGLLPTEMSVLDPNQAPYMQGYGQGEPVGYAGLALPLAAPAAVATGRALAPKAGLLAEDYIRSMGGMTNIVPMDAAKVAENAPKALAIYHGTSPEAAASIARRGFNVNKSADGSIWFTENPNIGEVSATGKGAVVKRILDEDKLKLATPEQADKYFIDQLISEGYAGVKYPGYGAEGFTHYQIFDPKKLGKETKTKKITKKVENLLD